MASYAVVVSQIYSEKQGPVGLRESLFLQLFPVPKGFLGPFFILVLVNLPSAELSRLSSQKIPQNKSGNSRLISVIERFHSRGQHLCKFIGTKESVCIRKEFNSQMIGLGHQHGRRFIVLGHQYDRRDVM